MKKNNEGGYSVKYTLEELNNLVERANKHGGVLWLNGLTSIPEGFNPTVGGVLGLDGLTSIPEGFNPTVGGNLWLNGLTATYTKLKDGDYVEGEYLYCDGMLTHIKSKRQFGEYTYFKGKIPGVNVVYDGQHYAHCKSFKAGVRDIEFKKARDRGAEQYRSLTRDSTVTYDEAVTMYRVITGACQAGTEHFIKSLPEIKESYTVAEIIDLTKGQYRADVFREFFEKTCG